ncbi:MAG TPA: rubredoxin [Clostridia bacterium]|nr:rubredoxin [Clostridia bacterium]
MQYVCSVCGYVYDEAKGIPDAGIAPGTRWEDLPGDWVCPLCGATKAEFKPAGAKSEPAQPSQPAAALPEEWQALSALEMSALCSNLARGCEKQYQPEEAAKFMELAAAFKSAATPAKEASFEKLLELVESDLNEGIPAANAAATAGVRDRGALRALVWNEKVTRILKSLIARYQKEGEAMLENAGVFVCTICGFIYVGDRPPELCPVCKVPNWKFEKIESIQGR